jgi:hypothetical protein
MPISIAELDALARDFFEGRGEQVRPVLEEKYLSLRMLTLVSYSNESPNSV